ncbi:MAG: hypothetical protein VST71_10730 [Nitrospirota bacterium]|nr:hypothetical protein [Nitrospirota bacterium]
MGEKVSWFNTSNEQREYWERLCPPNEYRILSPSSFFTVIPDQLIKKAESIFLVSSGSPQGQILYMANIHRVDSSACAIDQEPFGIVFNGSSPSLQGCLLHHGKWNNRSVEPPQEFWTALNSCGIGNCYPFSEVPSTIAGHVSDLKVKSQHDAFSALVDKLKNKSLIVD